MKQQLGGLPSKKPQNLIRWRQELTCYPETYIIYVYESRRMGGDRCQAALELFSL